jgi:molybdopterin-binding protein
MNSTARYRVPRAAELLGVSSDTVRRWVEAGRLAAERDGTGRWVIDGVELARFAVQVHRKQVAVHPGSTRNRFVGLVTEVRRGDVTCQVELQCGPFRVVSVVTTEAVDELGLAPGVTAVAAVKATNVSVDLL